MRRDALTRFADRHVLLLSTRRKRLRRNGQ